jgi:hypothetical protein
MVAVKPNKKISHAHGGVALVTLPPDFRGQLEDGEAVVFDPSTWGHMPPPEKVNAYRSSRWRFA